MKSPQSCLVDPHSNLFVCVQAIMIMYFMNTNSLLLANAYFPSLRAILKDTWAGRFVFLGIYNDISPNWYIDVGRPVAFSQVRRN
jgi:hypothetical protein